ncbi:MAG: M28 family peptidase [Candidatus Cloacimonetes bacterium]|nr:M28 family peptidase [Candidatus Cloacimonadota bacterium]
MKKITEKADFYLKKMCVDITERCVGSEGNREATSFFAEKLKEFGWETETDRFEAIDWVEEGASLEYERIFFKVLPSPYSLGCNVTAEAIGVSTVKELELISAKGKIIFLHDEIAKEQIMPKNFVFYNPEEHQKIVSLLENSGALALVCATGRNPSLAGGVYPFPLFEDGDFDIPSVYMTEEEGEKFNNFIGREVSLLSRSQRINSYGFNVIGRRGKSNNGKIVITAHIDAKKGTPGAIDNATGVVFLLLLAEMLKDYTDQPQIELVAFNGEDYYAVSGQMSYIARFSESFSDIIFNINIDGLGLKEGKTAFSFFNLPDHILATIKSSLENKPDFVEGIQWFQGDHSIFLQYGRPAVAISSEKFINNMDSQDITHTAKDKPEIVDVKKVVESAKLIAEAIREIR